MKPAKLEATLDAWAPTVLSLVRIMVGLLILQFGVQKILGFPPNPAYTNLQIYSLIGTAGMLELVGGTLLVLGLLTRPVAFILAGEMAFAYFIAHAPRAFMPITNGGTLAAVFCFIFFYFVFAGPGPYSLDAMMRKK